MSVKEKAPGSVGALSEAAWVERSRETFSISDFTTSGPRGQAGKISRLLLCGEENAIPGPELARMAGVSPRALRLMVDTEQLERPICASDHGYFLPDDGNKGALELQRFLRRMDSRCAANRRVTKLARAVLRELSNKPLDGQQSFFDGGGND